MQLLQVKFISSCRKKCNDRSRSIHLRNLFLCFSCFFFVQPSHAPPPGGFYACPPGGAFPPPGSAFPGPHPEAVPPYVASHPWGHQPPIGAGHVPPYQAPHHPSGQKHVVSVMLYILSLFLLFFHPWIICY